MRLSAALVGFKVANMEELKDIFLGLKLRRVLHPHHLSQTRQRKGGRGRMQLQERLQVVTTLAALFFSKSVGWVRAKQRSAPCFGRASRLLGGRA